MRLKITKIRKEKYQVIFFTACRSSVIFDVNNGII